jgi:hypothetical protein
MLKQALLKHHFLYSMCAFDVRTHLTAFFHHGHFLYGLRQPRQPTQWTDPFMHAHTDSVRNRTIAG